MLDKKTIGFVGGGNLAEALIKGIISSRTVPAGRILVSDRISERLAHISGTYEVKVFNKNFETARNADIIFITVKPNDVREALREIASELTKDKLLICAAAGITTKTVTAALKDAGLTHVVPVVRAMPNTPVTVREGATALYSGAGASQGDLKVAVTLFSAVGKVTVVEDEGMMDAVTGLSGSGPAYIFLIMEALTDAGVKEGLPLESARTLALQTTLGAAKLAIESGTELKELRRMVSSPGGTTIEGLKKLEEARIREILHSAVVAAKKRSKELSGS